MPHLWNMREKGAEGSQRAMGEVESREGEKDGKHSEEVSSAG